MSASGSTRTYPHVAVAAARLRHRPGRGDQRQQGARHPRRHRTRRLFGRAVGAVEQPASLMLRSARDRTGTGASSRPESGWAMSSTRPASPRTRSRRSAATNPSGSDSKPRLHGVHLRHPGGVTSCGVGGALSGCQCQLRNTLAPEQPPNFVTLGRHRTARSGAGHRDSYRRPVSAAIGPNRNHPRIWYDHAPCQAGGPALGCDVDSVRSGRSGNFRAC